MYSFWMDRSLRDEFDGIFGDPLLGGAWCQLWLPEGIPQQFCWWPSNPAWNWGDFELWTDQWLYIAGMLKLSMKGFGLKHQPFSSNFFWFIICGIIYELINTSFLKPSCRKLCSGALGYIKSTLTSNHPARRRPVVSFEHNLMLTSMDLLFDLSFPYTNLL